MSFVLFLATVACALPPLAARAEDTVRDLSRRIAKEKDAVDPAVFDQLAGLGGDASFKALEKSLRVLKNADVRAAAYSAFRLYREDPELAAKSLALLAEEADRAKEVAWREAAVRALVLYEEDAIEPLEAVSRGHRDPSCRTLATDVLLIRLIDRGDDDDLRTVLASASLVQDASVHYLGVDEARRAELAKRTHRAHVRAFLERKLDARTLLFYAELLDDEDASRVKKLMVLRLVAEGLATDDASRVVADACSDRDAAVALLAVDLLVLRKGFAGRETTLRPLMTSKEPALRRASVLGLGQVLAGDPAFAEEVLVLARSKDPATRMGAAGALVEVRTPEALAALHALLADPEWSVRVEALQRIGVWRDKSSIPLLVERLGLETGRMQRDVQAALVDVTRIDLGRLPATWARWWEREGERFVVPAADAREVVTERVEDEGRSVAKRFYDIRVLSERVAFVLDVSGSMRKRSERSVGTVEVSRMDVAKEELTEVLRGLPDGTLFNVIFFESELRPLEKKLVEMDASTRARALRFVREQYAVGATALFPALELAFADPLVDSIYLLSDGAPTVGEITDIEEIRAEVGRWNSARHVRIHGIAMGEDSTLLRWLCADTGGTYRRVN